ncbi:hypothetical protein [Streptomyces sp. NPDC093600]|uniref:hypothetical protein n=1 Tax=Streptomyces sp. NPDC093600 TaxID=3366047 RepID=UPI00380DB133
MARENRDQRAEGRTGDHLRHKPPAPAYRDSSGAAGNGPDRTAGGGVPFEAAQAQNTGRPAPSAPPSPHAPPVTGNPPTPLSASPLSAEPSGDPGATGRNDRSPKQAPAATPAAPRGRQTTDPLTYDGHTSGSGRESGDDGSGDLDAGGDLDANGARHASGPDGNRPLGLLLGDADRDRLGQRLHHALAAFVDSPRSSVAEAAEVLDEVEEQLIASLRDRRAALRAGWQGIGDSSDRGVETEQLRLTLRTYREVTEHLLGA